MQTSKSVVIVVLGATQTLAWASSYYLPAILADRIAGDLGLAPTWFFAAFSMALVISAMLGPRVGRTVDAIGGREVLAASNAIMAVGLAALAAARSPTTLWLAWLILGAGMGIGLYDTAFATLGRMYGTAARSAEASPTATQAALERARRIARRAASERDVGHLGQHPPPTH